MEGKERKGKERVARRTFHDFHNFHILQLVWLNLTRTACIYLPWVMENEKRGLGSGFCVLRSALLLLCLGLEMEMEIGDWRWRWRWRLEIEMEKLHRSECILSIL